jgi:two-component system, chemotaxis family, sensor kinase CheA
MDDLILEFLAETNESLGLLDQDLIKLESTPNDPDLLSKIFRIMHTIKGTCGFLGLPRLEKVAHAGENILCKFRDKELVVNEEAVSLVLASLDTIRIIVDELAATGIEPAGDDSPLKERIQGFIDRGGAPADATPVTVAPPIAMWCGESDEEVAINLQKEFEAAQNGHGAETSILAVTAVATVPTPVITPQPIAVVAATPAAPPSSPPAHVPAAATPMGDQSIRVNVQLLEDLMNVVSELVLTRNQLLQILRNDPHSEFAASLQRLNHNVSELQEGVMKTRMQPIGNAWQKLPRIVRDLCVDLGKDIDLIMNGEETELDRQVLELIKDPLMHMVRNSADHGVEVPADRVAAGKSGKGHIWLSAYHEGGHIIIEIKDDGKGLNSARIREKAVENGLMSFEEAQAASQKQIQNLIFHAGFSTAKAVTAVSGRGVGMDVVRSNIEKIGGTIELTSEEGKGTRFLIKIPLTLAIVSALIVGVGDERFAIPQICVRELVRTNNKDSRIEEIQGAQVLRLRNRLLPLLNLSKILKLDKPQNGLSDNLGDNVVCLDSARQERSRQPFIVVTQVGNYSFGMIVDQVFDMEEIVVKPISPILRHVDIFSGNTILGDGRVIMILDPLGVAKAGGEEQGADNGHDAAAEAAAAEAKRQEVTTMLLFHAGIGAPKAVPLSLLGRLEEFSVTMIEESDGQHVIQYRGELMPLLLCDSSYKIKESGTQPVIVFFDNDHAMGLVVDQIIDIVEESLNVHSGHGTPGILGSAIINHKATDVLDVGYYLERAHGDWFGSEDASSFNSGTKNKKILLVDDSSFFRNMLEPLLRVAGYDVTVADDPLKALALRDSGKMFDVIISDIEMPHMSGFDLAVELRKAGAWSTTPMIALSSHATKQDIEHGKAVGFSDYVAKFDRDGLLDSLSAAIQAHIKVA